MSRQEDDVRARKLQPIYNAIDSRNYKMALKLCAKKDLEKWDIVKALKAHALERTGRADEALDLCREVKARNPTDETLLTTICLTFKVTGQTEEAAEVYENALKQQPDNEEFSRELFFCFVKQRKFLKQQQLATKLFKQFSKSEYIYWAAVSMLLQARETGVYKMVELGERMIHKVISDGSAPTYEELRLYLLLLEDQGKLEEALSALKQYFIGGEKKDALAIDDETTVGGRSVVKMTATERANIEIFLLKRLERWKDMHEVCLASVQQNPDEWSYWLGATESFFALHQDLGSSTADLLSFLVAVKDSQQKNAHFRGPYLAELEVLRFIFKRLGPDASVPTREGTPIPLMRHIHDLVVNYIQKFCNKLCCFDDIAPYLEILGSQASVKVDILKFLNDVTAKNRVTDEERTNVTAESKASVTRKLQTFILAAQARRFLSQESSTSDLVEEARLLGAEYVRTLFINEDATGGQREVQLGDDLGILAVHCLRDLWRHLEARGKNLINAFHYKVEAAMLLEQALRYSPYNYHFKILLIQVYQELGAFQPALLWYNDMKVKQIQVESISWILFPGCFRTGFFSEAAVACKDIASFHRGCSRESSDYIIKAFASGTYTQTLEIDSFQKNKMDRSLQLALAKSEQFLLELLLQKHKLENVAAYIRAYVSGMVSESLSLDPEELTKLADNMDRSVIKHWDTFGPEPLDKAEARKSRFVKRIKVKLVLSRILLSLIQEDWSTMNDRISEYTALLSDLGYIPSSDMEGAAAIAKKLEELTISGASNGLGGVRGSVFQLSISAFRLGALVLEHFSSDGGKSKENKQSQVVESLKKLEGEIASIKTALLGVGQPAKPVYAPKHEAEGAPPSGIMDAEWLRTICDFLLYPAQFTVLVLQKIGASIPAPSKKKGKKGKGAGEEGSGVSKETKEIQDAFKDVVNSFVGLLSEVEGALRGLSSLRLDSPEEFITRTWDLDQMLTFLREPDFLTFRHSVIEKLRDSFRMSACRLADVLRDKISALQVLRG